ncbi:MAG: hypothetical protein PHD43_16280 [Methylococcales bacterium]|nr:hypothetical protein [Methylococcales bacterium]
MKKVANFVAQAKKIAGEGTIEYCLWVDDFGNLYVQFEKNNIDTTSPGTFTGLLFSVSKYAHLRNSNNAISDPTGYDTNSKSWKIGEDNNNPGFLKAVLCNLLPKK